MKMKKIAITFMSLILLLTISNFNFISAHENMSKDEVYAMIKEVNVNDNNEIEIILNLNENEIKNLSQDELSIIHDTVAADCIDNQFVSDSSFRSRPEYWTEYGTQERKTFSGFAGNQPPNGTKFPTGGGFWWSDSGGPTTTLTLTYKGVIVPVTVTLGISSNQASNGRMAHVPNTIDYFKLFVEKTYYCKPQVTYYKNSSGEVSVYSKYVTKIWVSDVAYAKKV